MSATRPIPATCTYSRSPSSSSGLESGGVARVALCRRGGRKDNRLRDIGTWRVCRRNNHSFVVAFSNLPSGHVACSPDDI